MKQSALAGCLSKLFAARQAQGYYRNVVSHKVDKGKPLSAL